MSDGITLSWSDKSWDPQFATFKLPCGKCPECHMEYARQWAIRCIHEAQMHEENCFITLTYSDEHLTDPKLSYSDFQKFMKRLRKLTNNKVGVFVTGEYGIRSKRKHWHAIIFNWSPRDLVYWRSNDRGDRVYKSDTLMGLWPYGYSEVGAVNYNSAGYVARYSAKALEHGLERSEYSPISRKSSKQAIGKAWIEKYWPDVFNHNKIILRDGTETSVPRYYIKWLEKHQPEAYLKWLLGPRSEAISNAEKKENKEKKEFEETANRRLDEGRSFPLTRTQVQSIINDQKFKQLHSKLKL